MDNNIDKSQLGMRRKKKEEEEQKREKKTAGSVTFEPERKEEQDRSFPEKGKLFEKPKRKLTTKDLPKSIRLSIETHTAISTLATIEDMKIYEVINMLVEEKVESLPLSKQKLVKNTVKQALELKKSKE
ncbi:hypothetical protein COL26_32660 [Bacillus thuringiensis]|uniref:Uncharacterized protein n=1 Tax=Bacillus thuringiensis TaxID=1428 RepID=A0ABD6RWN0_BACTU|nr:hypothetical protein [Bacillus thuringiensis]PER38364.1 hypothetical protein CN495_34645 [Bacillus thuringiensis]PEU67579.1 hypothetical protein CN411_34615 [Bacillus thuringiensis]PFI08649.1 hypothetical protein COI79_13795 [Bacillus thuringiensis]PFW20306.1 hypothetical protein COL26_32660 [Bacillus thuringiensis]PGY63962.1 hypothetical protein COE44_31645 [Bacillus thuringiensis]